MNKKEILLAILLVTLATLARFIPHMPNFVPITAIALFSGRYFGRFWAYLVPLTAMLVSDYFIGFSDVTFYVYFSLILVALVGYLLKKNHKFASVAGATLFSSLIFFVITNFGVWQAGWYGHTLSGLVTCFEMAIPFFRNSLMGDVFYTAIIFGAFELVKSTKFFKTETFQTATIKQ